jgi:hypothetical protein
MKSFYRASGMNKNRAGFGAIFNNTVNVCKYHYEKFNNNNIFIDNNEINEIFYTKEINNKDEYLYDLEKSYDNSMYPNPSNAHVICDIEKVKEKNKIFNIFFKLKDIEYYEFEKNKYINDKTLSIHIRGTDKSSEVTPPNIEYIFSSIQEMIDNNEIDNIFLATDDMFYIDKITSRFGNIVKYYKDKTISLDGRPLHFIDDRTKLNKELMTDVYLLSESKYFLYCFSNVSYLALTMGINNFKKIKCINEN